MDAANKAVSLKPDSAEYQRILGTLCGQMISSNSLAGLKYGKCALDSVDKAIELDPKSSMAYVSHGVGNYYLPQALGGGMDLAIKDFRKAIELNPKNCRCLALAGRRAAPFQPACRSPKGFCEVARDQSEPCLGQAAARKNAGLLSISESGNHRGPR